jgi:hypothetical protein
VFSDEFLTANLAALKQAQGITPEMAALEPARTRVLPDAGRGLRLHVNTPDGWAQYEEPCLTDYPAQLFVIGPGLGHLLDQIERAGAKTRVVALEPDPGVAVLLLARRDWTRWITDGRLRLLTGPSYAGAITCGRGVDVSADPVIVASRQLESLRPADVAAARDIAAHMISGARANADARKRFAGRYLLQSLANLPQLAREGDAKALDGLGARRPAVVVGAGPSLDDNLNDLRDLQDRAVIISVDTALRPLLAAGIRPHLVVAVDPSELNARHLAGVEKVNDIWLAAEASLHPSAFGSFAGRTFLFKVGDHAPWPWLATLGVTRATVRAWGSVVTSAFDLAVRMQCDPIVFAGLDLSYPVRRPYCSNTIYDQVWRDAMDTYGCTWEALVDDYFNRLPDLKRKDLNGEPVQTTRSLVSFRDWLREQIAGDGSRRYVNATGAGILHGPRLVQASLRTTLEIAPSIGPQVRAALRAAHGRTAGPDDRVRDAVRGLMAGGGSRESQSVFDAWSAFTAGTVAPAAIREHLAMALPSLA